MIYLLLYVFFFLRRLPLHRPELDSCIHQIPAWTHLMSTSRCWIILRNGFVGLIDWVLHSTCWCKNETDPDFHMAEHTIILPSILRSFCSYNQIWTFCRLWRNLKMRLICTIRQLWETDWELILPTAGLNLDTSYQAEYIKYLSTRRE